jgi:nucleotide-binding universal stress UspA family protein
MDRLKTILVALDFSPPAEAALAQAFRLGVVNGAEITVLHAVQPLLYNRGWLDEEAARQLPTIAQLMDDASVRLRSVLAAHAAPNTVRYQVVAGHTLATILDWCERLHPDLLVLGAHSVSDAYRHVGYTASGAIRKAAAPVLAVHANNTRAYQRILVATDFSATSEAALRAALRLASSDDAEIEVMHVYGDPWQGHEIPAWHRETVPDFAEKYAQRACRHIEEWARTALAQASGLRVSFAAVQHAKPGEAIVERAIASNADLVAMGTKGTTNLRYTLLGSTAEAVLRKVPCSVIAIKPD